MPDRQERRMKITRKITEELVAAHDMQVAETILARLIARSFAAEHPELFGPKLDRALGTGSRSAESGSLAGRNQATLGSRLTQ